MCIPKFYWIGFIVVLSVFLGMCARPAEPQFNNPYDVQSDSFITHPQILTLQVDNIGALQAWSGGEFVTDYGKAVTAKGVCWSSEPSPGTSGSCTNEGGGLEAFESQNNGYGLPLRNPGTAYSGSG